MTDLPHKIFEGDTLRKRVLRKMLEMSDGATVEERPKGRSKITFRDAGHVYGWDTMFTVRYDQVTPLSIVDMQLAFGMGLGDIKRLVAQHYGISDD